MPQRTPRQSLNKAFLKMKPLRKEVVGVAKPQGRPPKDPVKKAAYDAKLRESQTPGERNPIEGFFGLAKQRYRLGKLMSRKAKHAIGEVFLITMAVNIMSELARVLLCLFWTLQVTTRRPFREDAKCYYAYMALHL